jgi:hypothetical protein
MKKSKITKIGSSNPEIPAAVMEKLGQAFQAPAGVKLPCPEPEQVIGCALEELEAAELQKVQAHLLTCRNCLELFLDVRLSRAEAEGLMGTSLEVPQKTGWLATFGSKVRETLQALIKPRRLIPAVAAVSLLVLVVILGREEKSRVLLPTHLAMERSSGPTAAPSAPPPQESAEAKPSQAFPGRGLLASKRKFDTAAPVQEKSTASNGTLSEPGSIRLDLTEVPAPAGGARLSYRAERDVFAYLLRQDRSGNITLLFSGRLEGGKTYFYPGKEQQPKLDLATAQATVYLIAAKKPVADLKTKIQELERARLQPTQSLFPGATIRSLMVKHP